MTYKIRVIRCVESKKIYISECNFLSDDAARSELEAKYLERLFTDERTVNRLAVEKPIVFTRIKEWIEDAIIRFKGIAAEKHLIKTRELYVKAAGSGQSGLELQPAMAYSVGNNYDDIEIESSTKGIINKSGKDIPSEINYREGKEIFANNDNKINTTEQNSLNNIEDVILYEKYKTVLKENVPNTLDSFIDVKYNNIDEWKKLELDYFDQKIRNKIKSEDINKQIEIGKQKKHIKEQKGYINGRSYLLITIEEAQDLINKYAGTGKIIKDMNNNWRNQEEIHTDKIIGVCLNANGEEFFTSSFKIHYSKKGTHIVPKRSGI